MLKKECIMSEGNVKIDWLDLQRILFGRGVELLKALGEQM